jgi:hypothetical protein
VIANDKVLIPLVNGLLESHTLVEDGRFPWQYHAGGRTLVRPRVTPTSLAWPNNKGELYIGSIDPLDIYARLEALEPIVSTPAYDPPNIFAASLDGFVYCVNETRGELEWKYSTGNPIVEQPIAMEGRVYVCSEQGGMFCVETTEGDLVWWAPGVARFLSASTTRIYGLDDLNRIVIIDKETGARLSRMDTQTLSLFMTNELTDRLYVGTAEGILQCLHEVGQDKSLDFAPKPIVAPASDTPAAGGAPSSVPTPPEPGPAPAALEPAAPGPAAPGPAAPAGGADPAAPGPAAPINPFADDDPFGIP